MTDIASLSVEVRDVGIDDTRARLERLAASADRTSSSVIQAEDKIAKAGVARARANLMLASSANAAESEEVKAAAAALTRARAIATLTSATASEVAALRAMSAENNNVAGSASNLTQRQILLRTKFDESYASAIRLDAELADLAEAERLGVTITGGYSAALDTLMIKHDAAAAAAARQAAEYRELAAAEQLAATSADAQARFSNQFNMGGSGKSARDSAAVFEAQAREMDALQSSAHRLRAAIDPTAYAQERYNAEIAEYNMLASRGVISSRELAKAHVLAADRMAHANQLMNSMDSTPGGRAANLSNVVAQFQDIGVTAQMGMNPLTIALQQGTQLSQALLMMENPLKGIGQALLALISPLALMTLAMVALAAAAIQFVDWITVGQYLLESFADGLEAAAPYAVGLAAAVALAFAPQIIGGLVLLVAMIARVGVQAVITAGQMALAWAVAAGPFTLVVLGIAAIVTAMVLFRDQVAQIFGRDIVTDVKNAANAVIGAFVGAFEGIKASWSMLPAALGDLVIQAVNGTIGAVEGMLNFVIVKFNEFVKNINGAIRMIPVELRGGWEGLGEIGEAKFSRVANPNEGAAAKVNSTIGEAIKQAQGFDYVGSAITFVQHAASGAADAIHKLADGMGVSTKESKAAAKEAKRQAEKYDDLMLKSRQFIAEENLKAASLGMSKEAAAALRYEQEMLNKAANDNINLSPAQVAAIRAISIEMAAAEERTRVLTEWYNTGKSAFSSFIQDFKNGIMEGNSLWDSFASAAAGALDKIADKALSMAADGIFDMIFGAVMGGITGGIGGGVTGGTMGNGLWGSAIFNAKGNVFDNSPGLSSYSSQVITRPTAFAFANGAGIMGEAGPEAVMPLRRGADGKLGVVAGGSGRGGGSRMHVTVGLESSGLSIVPVVREIVQDGITVYRQTQLQDDIMGTVNDPAARGNL